MKLLVTWAYCTWHGEKPGNLGEPNPPHTPCFYSITGQAVFSKRSVLCGSVRCNCSKIYAFLKLKCIKVDIASLEGKPTRVGWNPYWNTGELLAPHICSHCSHISDTTCRLITIYLINSVRCVKERKTNAEHGIICAMMRCAQFFYQDL